MAGNDSPANARPEGAPPAAIGSSAWVPRFLSENAAWWVLIVSLLITGLSWWLAHTHARLRAQDRFHFEVQQAHQAIVKRMQEYEQVLRSGVGLFVSSTEVTRHDWHDFVANLDIETYWPGLQGIGYSAMVRPQDKAAFIAAVQQEGFRQFTIYPAGERALYSSILYLEPFAERNRRAFGYDMYSEPTRHAAMQQACDSGRPALSGPVRLLQENGQDDQAGFLMYMPYYHPGQPLGTVEQRRTALAGFVYSPFRANDLMQGILGQNSPYIEFNLRDSTTQAPLYLSPGWDAIAHQHAALNTVEQIQLPGRTWTAHFASTPALENELRSFQPAMVAIGGLVVDLLLFAVIRSMSLHRRRTTAWANETARLLERLQLSSSVYEHAREGILITDVDGIIQDVNPMFETLTGYSKAEVLGRNPSLLKSGQQDQAFYQAMWQALQTKGHWDGEIWNRRKSGEVYAEAMTISSIRNAAGDVQYYIALFSDITPVKHHQSQLEHLAHYDALTSLPNRILLGDRLQQAMAQAQRRGLKLAVVYLDLDGFKAVNDGLGHEAGDRLLVQAAKHMKDALREGDTLARLGGDEFVAVLLDLPDTSACLSTLQRLLDAAIQDVHINGTTRRVSASLGVTFYPQHDELDAEQLLRQADQAMYQAKLAGKNRYHIFDMERDRAVRGHHDSLERIRQALEQNEFVLYYQPKVNMRSGEVLGAEALIRWQHPERGLLPPDEFLPTIEGHPLSLAVGNWVLHTALAQLQQWRQQGQPWVVSVNISALQIQQSDFVDQLQALLAAYPGVTPGTLELEVLETSALEDMTQVSEVIERCLALGVTFALDDFGTGYSSLTYLKRLHARTLKVDRSFVRDMLDDQDNLAILEGVLGLARAFDRVAVAEGVESEDHGTLLLDLGCDLAQGYGIARPMPAQDLPGWSTQWQPPVHWLHRPYHESGTPPFPHPLRNRT